MRGLPPPPMLPREGAPPPEGGAEEMRPPPPSALREPLDTRPPPESPPRLPPLDPKLPRLYPPKLSLRVEGRSRTTGGLIREGSLPPELRSKRGRSLRGSDLIEPDEPDDPRPLDRSTPASGVRDPLPPMLPKRPQLAPCAGDLDPPARSGVLLPVRP